MDISSAYFMLHPPVTFGDALSSIQVEKGPQIGPVFGLLPRSKNAEKSSKVFVLFSAQRYRILRIPRRYKTSKLSPRKRQHPLTSSHGKRGFVQGKTTAKEHTRGLTLSTNRPPAVHKRRHHCLQNQNSYLFLVLK